MPYQFVLKKHLINKYHCDKVPNCDEVSPSGKAADFESAIPGSIPGTSATKDRVERLGLFYFGILVYWCISVLVY